MMFRTEIIEKLRTCYQNIHMVQNKLNGIPGENLNILKTSIFSLLPPSLRPTRISHLPISYTIYVTGNCNFNCEFCYLQKSKNRIEDLTMVDFKKIINHPFNKYANKVTLGGAEPFLHKDLFNFIRELKNMKKYLSVYTNGSLLDKYLYQIRLYKFDSLYVSHYDEMYEEIQSTVRRICQDKIIPHVCLSKIITSNSFYRMEELISIALRDKIDYLIFKNYYPMNTDELNLCINKSNDDYFKELHRIKAKFRNARIKISFINPIDQENNFNCQNLGLNIIYDSKGNIAPCCFIVPPAEEYGNLLSDIDIWNSNKILELREGTDHRCRFCYFRQGIKNRLFA